MDQTILIAATAVFLLAGIIKGTIGLGLPTTSVGLMASLIDPRLAIALVVVPMTVTNFWQILRSGHVVRTARRYAWFGVTLAASLLIVTIIAGRMSGEALAIAIGFVISIFALSNLFLQVPELPDRLDRVAQVGGGILSGIFGGLTSIWSPPMIAYFLSRRLDKDEFVRASGLLLFLGSLPLGFGYWRAGLMTGPTALTSLAMCVPAIIGFAVGEKIRANFSSERFRPAVLIVFLLMGINLVRRAFW
ncbi:MAG TPA: sulfite exporter TauE/SafE family protein [Afifellaceae bacterium]|nr:sulfite exporter TauE/SafE family protein [Afifellaceae bacterium]